MNKMNIVALVLTGFAFSQSSLADEYVCSQGAVNRTISVVYEKENMSVPCMVKYDKSKEGGEIQYPWNARNEVNYCEKKAEYLVSRLESLNWQCKKLQAKNKKAP